MGDQRGARRFAKPVHDVEHPTRQPGFIDDFRQLIRRQRRPFGRLQDDRVASRQRWSDFPRLEHKRCIPRRDEPGHADRLVDGVVYKLTMDVVRFADKARFHHFRVKAEVFRRAGGLFFAWLIGMPVSSASK